MNGALFLIAGLALILFLEKTPIERKLYLATAQNAFLIFKEAAALFAGSLIVLALYLFLQKTLPGLLKENEMFLFWPLTYGISRFWKKSSGFFAALLGVCLYYFENGISRGEMVPALFLFSSGIALFQFLLMGLKTRLVFSPVPKSLAGLPALFILALVVTFCFARIWLRVYGAS